MSTAPITDEQLEEARTKLARLEADHHAAERTRADRVREARRQLASTRWESTNDSPAGKRRDEASQAWAAIVADPDATLDGIFRAWAERRIASAVRFTEARHFASMADQVLGVGLNAIGVQVTRPKPTEEGSANWQLNDALAEWITARTAAAQAAAVSEWRAEEEAVEAEAEKG